MAPHSDSFVGLDAQEAAKASATLITNFLLFYSMQLVKNKYVDGSLY